MYEEGIFVKEPTADKVPVLRVEYNPTVPHCSLATLIGLCIRIKIQRSIHHPIKLDIYIKKGAHTTEDESKYLKMTFISNFYTLLLVILLIDNICIPLPVYPFS